MKGSIRKRGTAWRLVVDAGRDTTTGKRRQITRTVHGTEREARAELHRLLVEAGRGDVLGHDATLAQLLDAWMTTAKLEVLTRRDYESVIRTHIAPAIGARKVWQLRARDLDALYAELARQGLGPARIRRVHNIVARALKQAVRWEWVPRNVARDASPPTPPRPDPKPPATDEVLRLLRAADGELLTFLRLDASLGARRGEMCALRWRDVDLDAGTVTIRSAVVDGGPGLGIIVKATKTDRPRPPVALDPGTLREIRAHRQFCAERLLSLGVRLGPETFVFHRDADGLAPWRPDSASRRFAQLRAELGLDHVALRSLRHYVATELLAKGVDVRTVAGRLGHARTSTTLDIYAAFVPAQDQAAADLLGAALDG